MRRRAIRLLVDHEAADRRRSLEAGGGVDDVAGSDPFPRAGLGAELDDGFAGGDSGPDCKLELLRPRSARDRVDDPQPSAHRALGIVLVRHRRAEDRHHRVADELLDRAAEALDLAGDTFVIRA